MQKTYTCIRVLSTSRKHKTSPFFVKSFEESCWSTVLTAACYGL